MAGNSLDRFLKAQESTYSAALSEIRNGRKQTHWMWFIFPQPAGLGYSQMSKFYGIRDLNEAELYLQHPVLGERLIEISGAVLELEGKTANQIFGYPDDLKLKSCMELFRSVPNAHPVFGQVLKKYY